MRNALAKGWKIQKHARDYKDIVYNILCHRLRRLRGLRRIQVSAHIRIVIPVIVSKLIFHCPVTTPCVIPPPFPGGLRSGILTQQLGAPHLSLPRRLGKVRLMRDPLVGLVGKPSSGKSTTLNALTDADAKVGAFPFTTIDPNTATGYVAVPCACSRPGINKQSSCAPNYGWCSNGTRHVPVTLLDVAGLVPGAHEGRGLGNKFLDDLRHADCLIHVVDASGTTDAEGKSARGYDPLADVDWLQDEIFRWVKGNLVEKWGSIVRRHVATKSAPAETLANQFSGYGATRALVQRALYDVQKRGDAGDKLEKWTPEEIDAVVRTFVNTKFPTVLALNKSDHPDSDRNVARIARKYPDTPHVLCSAISEVLLRKLAKQKFIHYEPGTEFVDTREDGFEDLKPLDPKLLDRVETVRDLVLYRFGSTGVQDALRAAIDMLRLVPVFTVRNINNFGGNKAFPDCILVPDGTTVRQVCSKIMGEVKIMWIEGVNGKLADDDVISKGKNDILSFKRTVTD